jgi:5-methylcytosine-specific restriction endonuclease McrA
MAVQKRYGKPLNFKTKKAQAIRAYIYQRDNYTCQECQEVAVIIPLNYDGKVTLYIKDGWLEIDHIKSRFRSGDNSLNNLTTLCNRCNSSKGAI